MEDPVVAPASVHLRSPFRFLWWLVFMQGRRVAAGATFGSLWMVGLAVPPYLLSRAIDQGLSSKDTRALVGWVAALFAVAVVNALLAVARHRTMTKVRVDASLRMVRVIVGQETRLGATLARRATAGEVATIGLRDVYVIAQSLTVTGPGIGAVIAYAVVAFVLMSISPLLAVIVLAGVPMLAVTVGPLLHRLQHVGDGYREQQGALTTRLVDVVTGLRVLNGLGGKEAYADRHRRDSQALRAKGYQVGAVTSWVEALATGLPALFLAVVTWIAARMTAQGSITVGDLVAVYGYVAMLVVPVSSFIEGGSDLARAAVAARRVTTFLALSPENVDVDDPTAPDAPSAPSVLRDPISGVEVRPGLFTVLAGARNADGAAIIDRLGRFAVSDATWGGTRLDAISLGEVRERILVADNDAALFAGSVREVVAGRTEPEDDRVHEAIRAAAASDIVRALPDGLGSMITAQGRNLSGGQRQRLRMARALYAAPEILLAVEPTSAVDVHTEAEMAAGLRAMRDGRTTVVTSTSPLLLDHADVVVHLVDGRVAAAGTHRQLLRAQPEYQALVSRGAPREVHR